MKQVQAVFNAVSQILGDSFTSNETIVSDVLSPTQKSEVRDLVFTGIMKGDVAFKGDLENEAAVRRYVNGMVDNHLRKSQLLNGGVVYKPTGVGTKRDPQLRELNRLLKTLEPGSDDFSNVEKHITLRTSQLVKERAAKSLANSRSKIDTSILPDNLTAMLNKDS